ncbi:hypothetical protein [Dapis sp. BLCC M229]|uniref:hypothetical protein n=1 Tax=Dapis sp. BLCC M229 TaxID=3400188 RepID=UPI003CE6A331
MKLTNPKKSHQSKNPKSINLLELQLDELENIVGGAPLCDDPNRRVPPPPPSLADPN